jgi:hypothetical protein
LEILSAIVVVSNLYLFHLVFVLEQDWFNHLYVVIGYPSYGYLGHVKYTILAEKDLLRCPLSSLPDKRSVVVCLYNYGPYHKGSFLEFGITGWETLTKANGVRPQCLEANGAWS